MSTNEKQTTETGQGAIIVTEDPSESANIPEKIRVLHVDDDRGVRNLVEGVLGHMDEIGEVVSVESAERALQELKESQVKELRRRFHLLVSDLSLKSTDQGIAFLKAVNEMKRRPYIALHSDFSEPIPELEDLIDTTITKCDNSGRLRECIKEILPECRKHWESMNTAEQPKLPETAELSPLPPVRRLNTHNPMHVKFPIPILLADIDETLLIPSTSHSISLDDFTDDIERNQPELPQDRALWKALLEYFAEWRKQQFPTYRGTDRIQYKDFVGETLDYFARSMRGAKLEDLLRAGKRFGKKLAMANRYYGHTKPGLSLIRQYGAYVFGVTGALECYLPQVMEQLEIELYAGNRLAVETNGQGEKVCNGEIEAEKNVGTSDGKNLVVDRIKNFGKRTGIVHPIIGGIGNHSSDLALNLAGISSESTSDFHGFGIILNAPPEVQAGIDEYLLYFKSRELIHVLSEQTNADTVVRNIGQKLHETLMENPRNGKKMFDLLLRQNYTFDEAMGMFAQHFNEEETLERMAGGLESMIEMARAMGCEEDARKLEREFRKRYREHRQSVPPRHGFKPQVKRPSTPPLQAASIRTSGSKPPPGMSPCDAETISERGINLGVPRVPREATRLADHQSTSGSLQPSATVRGYSERPSGIDDEEE